MTDYSEILDTQIAPDAPLTSALGAQFRDNPIAMAEGADGAPDIATNWVDANGGVPVWDVAVDGQVAQLEVSWPADTRFEYRVRLDRFGTTAGAVFYFQVWYATSGAWSVAVNPPGSWGSSLKPSGTISVLQANMSRHYHFCEYDYGFYPSIGFQEAASSKKYLATHTVDQQITKIRMYFSGGSAINLGKVWLEKRMCYV